MKHAPINFPPPKCGKGTLIISFEGIEGAGKSTQIEKVIGHFQAQGRAVHRFREPGATIFGEKLRAAILASEQQLHPIAEALTFAAARAQLIEEKILPIVSMDNQIIILDRFTDSSLAYQGSARKLGFETILELHNSPPLNIFPHLTFYLKIDWKTSELRQASRGGDKDYFEKEAQNFYQALITGFDKCASRWPERIKTIDATLGPMDVFAQIFKYIKDI